MFGLTVNIWTYYWW